MFCLLSCQEAEKTGLCCPCCDSLQNLHARPDFTRKMCEDYNNRKVDGYSWSFAENGLPCAPPAPK